ncbi:hypothetical protein R6Q57_001902 [Mikania cordata]
MAPEQEIFDVSGPLHLLNSLDWRNIHHQRSIAASLVHGVYVLEKDRQRRSFRHEHDTHAPPWWERFHFNLNCELVDDKDLSYFGAIYELKYEHPYAPKYVIAFRGTIKRSQTIFEDMKLNFKFVYGHPEESSRFNKAYEAVLNTVDLAGAANVWLAGHSLGATIAMLTGEKLAKCGFPLETYLFNPPFKLVLIEKLIKNQTSGVVNLFVNRSDPICSLYIGYFKLRVRIISLGSRAKLWVNRSLTENLSLTENRSLIDRLKKAHEIHQWWQELSEGSIIQI